MSTMKFDGTEREATVAVAVAEAFAEFQTLVDELKQWHKDALEKMRTPNKAEDLARRIPRLESVCGAPDVPENVKDLPIKYVQRKKRSPKSPEPKWLRAHNAWTSLLAVQDALVAYMKTQDPTSAEFDAAEQLHAELEELREPLAPYILPKGHPFAKSDGFISQFMMPGKRKEAQTAT